MLKATSSLALLLLLAAPAGLAGLQQQPGLVRMPPAEGSCIYDGPDLPHQSDIPSRPGANAPAAGEDDPSIMDRLVKYTQLALKHRVSGLASYYSSFFEGRKTASGEIYRNSKYSAAHLTLPLGTWIEVTSRATGRKLRLKVNDRGPFAKKFCLDLSQSAAHFLGVDVAHDRSVDIRIIALPGEEPLDEEGQQVADGNGGDQKTVP